MQLMVVIVLLGTLGANRVLAQEMNYNTFQVGSRSALMGGAVVAGVRDTSATFYNPAALGLVENPGISVSANAVRYGHLTIDNALGEGQDERTTLLAPIPLVISGMQRFNAAPEWAFGYALVTRQLYSGDFHDQVNMMRSAFTLPGGTQVPLPAQVTGQFSTSSQAEEFWAIGVAAWRVTRTLAVGIAPIAALRNQSRLDRFSFTTIPSTPVGGSALISTGHTTDISFYQLSFLTRFGIAWEPSARFKLGATVTTPNLKITGSGDTLGSAEFVNLPVASGGSVTVVGNDGQNGLATHYRTPFSVAWGAEITPWSAFTVGVAVEYSAALGRTRLLEVQAGRPFFRGAGADLISTSSDSAPFLTPFDQRRSVVNVSVGAEYILNTTYAAYLGFWTDFSPIDSKQVRDILVGSSDIFLPAAAVDLYHIVVGGARTIRQGKLAAGIVLSYGTGRSQSDVDITPTGTVTGMSTGAPISHAVSFSSISFLLGYTYFF
jgi:hypothetical protein